MSVHEQTASESADDGPEFRFVATGRPPVGDFDTRHEAIGALAKYGDWDRDDIVPIVEDCLVSQVSSIVVGPRHLGNEYYGDRDHLATKHGVVDIDHVSVVRQRNGEAVETIESYWEIECPVCYRTHCSDHDGEDARSALIDTVLDCCGSEWFAPSDYLDPCPVCERGHREQHECTAPAYRHPAPDADDRAECTDCDWSIDRLGDVRTRDGSCPECGSNAVHVGGGRGE